MKLYDMERSGNAYRVRLMLSLLGLHAEKQAVDLLAGEQHQPWFLAINPRHQVPVLEEPDGTVIWDSMAILVYLARQYGGERWLPLEPRAMAEVVQWLAVMESESQFGLALARAITRFGRQGDLALAQQLGNKCLRVLDGQLAKHDWLALGRLTIADIGCFPYVALAPEGGIDLAPYSAVSAWIERIKALPGFIGMPGIA